MASECGCAVRFAEVSRLISGCFPLAHILKSNGRWTRSKDPLIRNGVSYSPCTLNKFKVTGGPAVSILSWRCLGYSDARASVLDHFHVVGQKALCVSDRF
jgi:hypothetical protein